MTSRSPKKHDDRNTFNASATAASINIPQAIVISSEPINAFKSDSILSPSSGIPLEIARTPMNNSFCCSPEELIRMKSYPFPEINTSRTREFLKRCEWPSGLQEALIKSVQKIPIRFFVVDDSGSMLMNDGKRRLSDNRGTSKIITCTRWCS